MSVGRIWFFYPVFFSSWIDFFSQRVEKEWYCIKFLGDFGGIEVADHGYLLPQASQNKDKTCMVCSSDNDVTMHWVEGAHVA
jgi:hypothetical protein